MFEHVAIGGRGIAWPARLGEYLASACSDREKRKDVAASTPLCRDLQKVLVGELQLRRPQQLLYLPTSHER